MAPYWRVTCIAGDSMKVPAVSEAARRTHGTFHRAVTDLPAVKELWQWPSLSFVWRSRYSPVALTVVQAPATATTPVVVPT